MGKIESTLRKTSIIGFIVTASCLLFLCTLKLQEMYFRSYYMVLESSSEFETIKNGIIYFGRPSCPECKAVVPYKDMANHRTPFYMVTSVMLAVSIAMLLLSFFLSGRLVGRKWMSFVIFCDICMLFILVAGWAMGIMYIEKTGGSGNPEETINGLIANGLMVVTTVITIFRYNQKKQ